MCIYTGRNRSFKSSVNEIIIRRNGVIYINANFVAKYLGFSSPQSLLKWSSERMQNETNTSNNGSPTTPDTNDGTSTNSNTFKRSSK